MSGDTTPLNFPLFYKTQAGAVLMSHEISEISETSWQRKLVKYQAYQAFIVWPSVCI